MQYAIKNRPKLSQICSYGIFFLGTQARVRNSHGKRAISVRATEVLLYFQCNSSLYAPYCSQSMNFKSFSVVIILHCSSILFNLVPIYAYFIVITPAWSLAISNLAWTSRSWMELWLFYNKNSRLQGHILYGIAVWNCKGNGNTKMVNTNRFLGFLKMKLIHWGNSFSGAFHLRWMGTRTAFSAILKRVSIVWLRFAAMDMI